MRKFRLIFFSALLLTSGVAFYYRANVFNYFSPKLESVEKLAINAALEEIKKQVSAPEPLRAPTAATKSSSSATTKSSDLTVAGTINWTNIQRQENGNLPLLAENAKLDGIATERLSDMFAKQYFAHISPSGDSVTTVAASAGYDYLELGENLALGNFGSDAKVVIAWMNSPGHRANILNTHYKEIGVAVRKGIFEGESTWIAVQVFGKPASACPAIDQALKNQIETNQSELNTLDSQINTLRSEIGQTDQRNREEYNAKVDQYNSLVNQYNNLLRQVKAMISGYNAEVSAFNQCAAG